LQAPSQPQLGPLIALDIAALLFVAAFFRKEHNPAYGDAKAGSVGEPGAASGRGAH